MNTIKYEIIKSRILPGHSSPFNLYPYDTTPIETGSIGYDCAALLKFPGKFKTSKDQYDVLGTEVDISASEPVLRIYVDKRSW